MKVHGAYIVAVKRPEDTNWILFSDSGGEEYDLAVKRLEDCVEKFGKENAILLKRLYYTVEVDATVIGLDDLSQNREL